jgi:CheY-like chemotaxis protein
MSGEVGLDSTEGKGSRFWFRVQVALVEPGTDTRQVAREAAQTPVRPDVVRSGYVMVVEDTPVNQLVIKAMLGKHGYRVVCHENGHQAVEAITGGERPSLVLMDCQMPVMDGYAATAAIRQWEADNGTPRLPIVALTASAFEADRQHCLEAGMDDFLTKPVEINRLLEVLGRWFAPENRA